MKRQEIGKVEECNRALVMKEIENRKEYECESGISLWINYKG